MLFFGGSGCYLRWGHDCWFSKRFNERSYWQIADLTIWLRNPADAFVRNPEMSFSDSVHAFFAVPKFEDFDTEMSKLIGQNRRQQMLDSCPINRNTIADAKSTANIARDYFGL